MAGSETKLKGEWAGDSTPAEPGLGSETKLKGEWAGDSTPAEPGLGSWLGGQAVAVSSTR
jgi:hypothetical protein